MTEIVKIPSAILKKGTTSVPEKDILSGKYADLIEEMRAAMKEHNGIGLAANQLGHNVSIFVIDKKTADAYEKPDVYINPEVTEYSNDADEIEEGCLSVPQYYIPISRSKKVKLKALSETGEKLKIKARGFLARVFQHETDHLNGITIKDRHGK
ncbi:MAG: peptide deformylase [Patescibacteria group bacterium]|mgnify:CR=1 FL=1